MRSPINFSSCACSAVSVLPFSQILCGALSVGTPLSMRVGSPSFRSWGSSLWGNGSGGSEYVRMTGPAGRVTVRLAVFPARAKSGLWKSANHSVTSSGFEFVNMMPTWPWIRYLISWDIRKRRWVGRTRASWWIPTRCSSSGVSPSAFAITFPLAKNIRAVLTMSHQARLGQRHEVLTPSTVVVPSTDAYSACFRLRTTSSIPIFWRSLATVSPKHQWPPSQRDTSIRPRSSANFCALLFSSEPGSTTLVIVSVWYPPLRTTAVSPSFERFDFGISELWQSTKKIDCDLWPTIIILSNDRLTRSAQLPRKHSPQPYWKYSPTQTISRSIHPQIFKKRGCRSHYLSGYASPKRNVCNVFSDRITSSFLRRLSTPQTRTCILPRTNESQDRPTHTRVCSSWRERGSYGSPRSASFPRAYLLSMLFNLQEII